MNDFYLSIAIEDPTSEDALLLFQGLDKELLSMYSPKSVYIAKPHELVGERGLFFIARIDKKPVACGAFRYLEPGVAEVKRMYVDPLWRGKGISRQILVEIEQEAKQRGIHTLKLETGVRQPAAISLYESANFVRIPLYGEYVGDPSSVCFEKSLRL